jgi:regulation of enolase protein 1 (concanavalin A-like superfamily)
MDYTAMVSTVSRLIDSNSALTISYTVDISGDYEKIYDPATDAFKWYMNGVETTAPIPTTYTGKCIQTNISDYFKIRGYVNEKDTVFLTIDIPKPTIGATVTVAGRDYKVVRVSEVSPGGTDLLYRITARA